MGCSPPGSPVHDIFHARLLERVAISTPGNLPDPGVGPIFLESPALTGGFFTTSTTWEAHLQVPLLIRVLSLFPSHL